MKLRHLPFLILVLALVLTTRSALADPLGTAFTYQGQLKSSGAAYTGTCDMQFSLYDDLAAGTQIGSTQTLSGVTVTSGLFTVELDFGTNIFAGEKRFLEIAVKCGADAGYTTLSPRQQLTAVPYAVYARTAENFSGNLAGDVTGAQGSTTVEKIQGRNVATTAPTNGQVLKWNGSAWEPATDNGTSYTAGTGLDLTGTTFSILGTYQLPQSCSTNQIAKWNGSAWLCANDDGATNAWLTVGNSGTNAATNFLGTTDAQGLTLRVNNTIGWRLSPNGTNPPNVIGGYSGNTVTNGVSGASIGGGGASGSTNNVTDDYGTVAGGQNNRAGNNSGTTGDANFATVGGGVGNLASGVTSTIAGGDSNSASTDSATVSGGVSNTASGNSSVVSGGGFNTASGEFSFLGGGLNNIASGVNAIVTGGESNIASGAASFVGGGSNNIASSTNATITGGSSNIASGAKAAIGGGQNNVAAGDYSFVAGRRAKNSDATHDGVFLFADSTDKDFSSTAANQFRVRATGGVSLITTIESTFATDLGGWRIEPNGTKTPNIIGGYINNGVTSNISGAFIGGGGDSSSSNTVTKDYGVIGGGVGNMTSGLRATIGGGKANRAIADSAVVTGGNFNTASGTNSFIGGGEENQASQSNTAVGGGFNNNASGEASVISGGTTNSASSFAATVAGGNTNTASGARSTVTGGEFNEAAGGYSLVGGRRAKNSNAAHNGVFLFADSNDFDFSSNAANQFRARATGGVQFVTAIDGSGNDSAGVQVASGGGSWSSLSDRAAKQNFSAIDAREILQRVAQMPILKWNYKTQDARVQHIGPMAQDFYAAFNVGEDEKHITTIDADGVSLAAIQGLNQIVQEQNARIDTLEKQNASLEARLTALEQSRGTASNDWFVLPLCAGIFGASVWSVMKRRGKA